MQGAQAGLAFAARSSNKLNPFGLSGSSPGQPVEGTQARKAGNTVAASVPHPSTVAHGPTPQIPECKNPQPRPQWIMVRGVGAGTGDDRKVKMTLWLGWVMKLLVPAGSVHAQTCSREDTLGLLDLAGPECTQLRKMGTLSRCRSALRAGTLSSTGHGSEQPPYVLHRSWYKVETSPDLVSGSPGFHSS